MKKTLLQYFGLLHKKRRPHLSVTYFGKRRVALSFIEGVIQEKFMDDQMMKYGCVKCIEVIGEACKSLSEDIKTQHPEIDWRGAMGMRDRLVHDYVGIDYYIVWDTIQNFLPDLKLKIEAIIANK